LVPTGMGVPAVSVAVLIGITVWSDWFVTYTVFPSGVTARLIGSFPTGMGVPAVSVAVSIGVTVLSLKFATYAVGVTVAAAE